MIIKEVIEELSFIRKYIDKNDFYRGEEKVEALDMAIKAVQSAQPEQCEFCKNRGLEDGDTLYISADWDGGIGFDFIRDIHYCPKCGRRL